MASVVRGRPYRRRRGRVIIGRRPLSYTVYSGTVANAGNVATDATIEVAGPTAGSGFFVANDTAAGVVRVNFAVPTGQTLVVDMATRTATIAGIDQGAVFDLANSSWWRIVAGNNSIRASVPATVKHRNAYQ